MRLFLALAAAFFLTTTFLSSQSANAEIPVPTPEGQTTGGTSGAGGQGGPGVFIPIPDGQTTGGTSGGGRP